MMKQFYQLLRLSLYTSVGALCEYTETGTSETIRQTCRPYNDYFSSLDFTCQRGEPARVVWTPNHNTPDVVYYQVIRFHVELLDNVFIVYFRVALVDST